MGIKGYGLFDKMVKKGHSTSDMGLKGNPGDVTRFSYRLRIAKAFRGLILNDVAPRTVKGYDAFTLIFLVHSALEQYLVITKQKLHDIEKAHMSNQSSVLIAEFFASDRNGKLHSFLMRRLNEYFKTKMTECKAGKCYNVGVISGSIRHIYVHGHLAANSNGINPIQVHRICQKIATYLFDYMDNEFYEKMTEYAKGKKI
jgi:hypothetical protein